MSSNQADRKGVTQFTASFTDADEAQASSSMTVSQDRRSSVQSIPVEYRSYKRRFFGLFQLTLLNIIVSWDWLTFAPVSTTSSEYFHVSISAINWLSTAFLFAFVMASPFVIWTLNRRGPKSAILVASILILVGNWIRYAGTKAGGPSSGFGVAMFGQILIGFGQPFVLAAPTRYSEQWFSAKGRIVATALPSLANPFGGALGQLIDPFLATKPQEIPNMVLWVAVISTVATIPSLFIPKEPPTPPAPSASIVSPRVTLNTIVSLFRNLDFHLLFWPFSIYVSCFNAFSSLLNNILYPYGFSETDAGITGALLILVGLVSSAVASPILDRRPKLRLPFIKLAIPVIAIAYLAFNWAPGTRSVGAPYVISAIQGAASFSLLPVALEYLVDVTFPDVGPEVTSAICWSGGQLGGAIFIIIMGAMEGSWKGEPPGNLQAGLVFLTVFAWLAMPPAMALGYFGTGKRKREEAEFTLLHSG